MSFYFIIIFILYFLVSYYEFFILVGLPWYFSGKEMACQCRRHRFNPLVGKIPEEGNINPLQCSCLGNPMDRRSLVDNNSWDSQRVGHNLATKQHPSPWSSLYFHFAIGQIFMKHLKKSDIVKKSKLLNGVAVAV